MSVANPWMLVLPAPAMSHSLWGFPGFEFSHAMVLAAGGLHGANGSGSWAATLANVANPIPGGSKLRTAFVEVADGLIPATVLAWVDADAVVLCLPLPDTLYPMAMITELNTISAAGAQKKTKCRLVSFLNRFVIDLSRLKLIQIKASSRGYGLIQTRYYCSFRMNKLEARNKQKNNETN